ncbi:MAG: hypothetical protein JWP20_1026 [Roseomonas sp.]|jgi:hypothetical protein|nr:hypothetical protein [Roseomonas sp.]
MLQPSPSDTHWPATGEAAMAKAAALGRRDGLAGRSRDFMLEQFDGGLAVIDTTLQEPMPGAPLSWQHSRLMLVAVRQCYAAGRHHGGDVRLEQERRQRLSATG